MGAGQGEVDDGVPRRCQNATDRFGRDRCLMVDLAQEVRLDQLGLRQRRRELHEGLSGKDDMSLRDGAHLTAERKTDEWLQFVARPMQHGGEVFGVGGGDTEIGQVVERRFQSGADQEAAVGRQVTYEEAERRGPVHALLEVGQGHGHFVEVCGRDARHRAHRLLAARGRGSCPGRAGLPALPASNTANEELQGRVGYTPARTSRGRNSALRPYQGPGRPSQRPSCGDSVKVRRVLRRRGP